MSNHATSITICSSLSGMENNCWKADLTGALLVGNIYNICYRQNNTSILWLPHQHLEWFREDNIETTPPSERQVLSYEQQLNHNVSKAMGFILGSLCHGMCQYIPSLGYRTLWEMIEGILKSYPKFQK